MLHDITENIAGALLIIMCGTCLQMLSLKGFGIYSYMVCYNDYIIIFTGVLTSLKSDSVLYYNIAIHLHVHLLFIINQLYVGYVYIDKQQSRFYY
jgi:hypothetical protein